MPMLAEVSIRSFIVILLLASRLTMPASATDEVVLRFPAVILPLVALRVIEPLSPIG